MASRNWLTPVLPVAVQPEEVAQLRVSFNPIVVMDDDLAGKMDDDLGGKEDAVLQCVDGTRSILFQYFYF